MEMLQHDFQNFENVMILFSKKIVIEYSPFIFILHICAKFQTKKKFLITTCVFECFQSHCHILKKIHEFSSMLGALTIFGKGSFIFNFVGYELVTKSLGGRLVEKTFEDMVKKTKCQKMNVIFVTTK